MNVLGREWTGTCSVDNPKDDHATFARNEAYLKKAVESGKHLLVFVPMTMNFSGMDVGKCMILPLEWFEYEFAWLHNEINDEVKDYELATNDRFHKTAVIADGIREVNGPNGIKAHMTHIGNVTIGRDVRIGAYTVIQRAVFDSTIIKDGARIDSHCAIGHNAIIGENTVIASGVGIGGSAQIGKNCWIGGNSYIRNGVKVCDGTVIGCMSAVVKDINEPGIYAGVPAKFIKPVQGNWNF